MMIKIIGINYRFRVLLLLLICTPLFLFSQNVNNRNMGKLEPFYIVVDTTKVHVSPINSRNLLKSELGIKDAIDMKNYYQKGLKVKDLTKDKIGYIHHRFSQYYKGIRVEYTDIRVRYKNNKMVSANGWYLKTIDVDVNPVISFETAVANAIEYINAMEYIWEREEENEWLRKTTNRADTLFYPQPELVICHNYLSVEDTALYLAYKLNIYAIEPLSRDYVYVSALTGDVINIEPIIKKVLGTAHTRYSGTRTIATQLHNSTYRLRDYDSDRGEGIETYNMNNSTTYSNATDFTDNDNNWTSAEYDNAAKDNGALDAHWGAMMTYDYFFNIHGRDSYDDDGAIIKSYVHYGTNYENAFWNGSVMTYGDGNTKFDILTSLDVVAHEIGHAVCTYTANLAYRNESGAINESLSDIWSACVENYAAPNKQIWLIGEDIELRPGHIALRSMSNPKAEGQPDTYGGVNWISQIGCTPSPLNDYCGVHRNSGVMNYWFYLLSVGGSGSNDIGNNYHVTGIGINNAARIVYRALTLYMTQNSTFLNTRDHTLQSAIDLFGANSQAVASVTSAWYAVGVGDCTTTSIVYATIITNTTIRGCNISVSNVTIRNGAKLTLDAENETTITGEFEVQLGSELEIK